MFCVSLAKFWSEFYCEWREGEGGGNGRVQGKGGWKSIAGEREEKEKKKYRREGEERENRGDSDECVE